jgi:hypothetical protein
VSKTDQFWQYAREAILSVSYAEGDEEEQGRLILRGPGRKPHCKSAAL